MQLCPYLSFNPIPTEGGHFGPGQPKAVSHFHSFMTRVTKIHDFVHLSIPLIPVKLILKKEIPNFNKLKKIKFTVLTPKDPLWKKIKEIKFFYFFPKNYTIST